MNDLSMQHASIAGELEAVMAQTIQTTSFILGPAVSAFEDAYAAYCGADHCIGVSNGTDALVLALRCLDLQPGDEVITTPHTFGATAEAIAHVGGKIVFADVEDDHMNLDPASVADRITDRTRAILPVHIYGHPADMDPLLSLAKGCGAVVIEDAAQAQGARYKDRVVGSIGQAGCFSFYPGKNLGAYGDAGGVTTSDEAMVARIRTLRNHGQVAGGAKFTYGEIGYNHRMDGLQGAVLGVKLGHLDTWNARRREIAARYAAGLSGIDGLRLPTSADWAVPVYHLYVVRTDDREGLAASLKEKGVSTAIQYPHPLHSTPAFADCGAAVGDLPVTEKACREILSLPIFPELEDDRVDQVIEAVRHHFGS
ncbi:MAG: DegT/DnrJ/EryC1/StrS family aminotransferase [Gemmatimonadetes bacterium]|nr:DegT/DnrJ/EryC1/StrS family aminotransferase [Gemmatimonadota bacterium]MBT7859683.1 DegT/DnrJ/EryC1/StrS family aminotransferase [Gemmatimonadota bacterium]